MPTIVQVEEQIYACEGFRVRLTALKAAQKSIPSYDFLVMAPQRWRLSDWKTVRLRDYIPFIREIVVLRGDAAPVKSDIRLGNLRDTYYEAKHGSLSAEPGQLAVVTQLRSPKTSAPAPATPSGRGRRNR